MLQLNRGINMIKEEIIKTLEKISISTEKIIILGEASLVMQDLLLEANLVTIACPKNFYEALPWKKRLGSFNTIVKYQENIEVTSDFYITNRVKSVDSYMVSD